MLVDLDVGPVLKALAEPVRLRIVELLEEEELCVCHLVEALDLPQPLVSHHLKVLRDAGVVESERFRYWTYYRLVPAALAPLAQRLAALADRTPGAGDRRRPLLLMAATLGRKVVAEATGTALLVAVVVGSGIFAQRLSPDDIGLQLLENSTATAGGLVALILAFGSVSGAHFNPVVSLADRVLGGLTTRELLAYIPAQIAGACVGAVVANLMFDLDPITLSTHARSSGGLWLGEVVATFGLVMVILGVVRSGRTSTAPFAVAGYIAAAYWFTSSTSFANPAVTIGRTLTDTFAGIEPSSAPAFVVAQVVGGLGAIALARYLHPDLPTLDVIVPHDRADSA